jgi:hypothetical protein
VLRWVVLGVTLVAMLIVGVIPDDASGFAGKLRNTAMCAAFALLITSVIWTVITMTLDPDIVLWWIGAVITFGLTTALALRAVHRWDEQRRGAANHLVGR